VDGSHEGMNRLSSEFQKILNPANAQFLCQSAKPVRLEVVDLNSESTRPRRHKVAVPSFFIIEFPTLALVD
jgi:hypothetical protein